ncbi:MAG: class I SAM-dependent methyltransferase, partial [Actinomycetota bacterium]|nr:class I SAM-dependent methyltransferase [Actinomycetota bacterium]
MVTAVDHPTVALHRAAPEAQRLRLDVDWQHIDLTREPAAGVYDLVSAFYLHMPIARRPRVFAQLAAAVAPGGTLLIVGHDLNDLHTPMLRPGLADMGWTADEVAGFT